MNLISKNDVYKLPDGAELLEVNQNKITGQIKTISVTLSQKYGKPILFGIWSNWNENEWTLLGYEQVKERQKCKRLQK